jgi:hypothetical protein
VYASAVTNLYNNAYGPGWMLAVRRILIVVRVTLSAAPWASRSLSAGCSLHAC